MRRLPKTLIASLAMVLMSSVVLAQGRGEGQGNGHGNGQGAKRYIIKFKDAEVSRSRNDGAVETETSHSERNAEAFERGKSALHRHGVQIERELGPQNAAAAHLPEQALRA